MLSRGRGYVLRFGRTILSNTIGTTWFALSWPETTELSRSSVKPMKAK